MQINRPRTRTLVIGSTAGAAKMADASAAPIYFLGAKEMSALRGTRVQLDAPHETTATRGFPIYLLGVGVGLGAGEGCGLGATAAGAAVQDL